MIAHVIMIFFHFLTSPDALNRWEPNTKCVPINEVKSTSKSVAQVPVPIPTSENDLQEVFLNFHFSGSDLISPRPAVNTIHYKGPPVPLQVKLINKPNGDIGRRFVTSQRDILVGFL